MTGSVSNDRVSRKTRKRVFLLYMNILSPISHLRRLSYSTGMQEVERSVFDWVNEAGVEEQQARISFVRESIGRVLGERYQVLKSEETIILDSLGRLGVKLPQAEPDKEVYLGFNDYMSIGVELLDNKGIWTRLWTGLWHKHRDYSKAYYDFISDDSLTPTYRRALAFSFTVGPDWGKLFSAEGDLSITRLEPLTRNQNIRNLYKIGDKSLEAARLLVAHVIGEDNS